MGEREVGDIDAAIRSYSKLWLKMVVLVGRATNAYWRAPRLSIVGGTGKDDIQVLRACLCGREGYVELATAQIGCGGQRRGPFKTALDCCRPPGPPRAYHCDVVAAAFASFKWCRPC